MLFSQSLTEDVKRQMEREKDLQAKYASLRDELEELKRSLQMVAINNDVGQSNNHTTERTVEED